MTAPPELKDTEQQMLERIILFLKFMKVKSSSAENWCKLVLFSQDVVEVLNDYHYPVSYTHLDVYKRQMYTLFVLFCTNKNFI